MSFLQDIFNLLNSIGFTKESTIPLVFIGLMGYILFSKKINKLFTPIRHAIVEIQGLIGSTGTQIKYSLTETSASPLKPTEYGSTLVKESGLGEALKAHRIKLLEDLDHSLKK